MTVLATASSNLLVLSLGDEHRLRTSGNRVLIKISGRKKEKASDGLEKIT
jgi:hypothetical protein